MAFMQEIAEILDHAKGLSKIYDHMTLEEYVQMQCNAAFNFLTNEDRWKSMMRCAAKNNKQYVDIYAYEKSYFLGDIQFSSGYEYRGLVIDIDLISMIENRLTKYFNDQEIIVIFPRVEKGLVTLLTSKKFNN